MRLNSIPTKMSAHARARKENRHPGVIGISLCSIYGYTCKGIQPSSLPFIIRGEAS